MSPLLTPKRLHLYPLAVLCGAVIGFIVLVATSNGLETAFGGRMGGDFPAFYGAGRSVRLGLGHSLYDPSVQRQLQADLLVHHPGGWIHFAYPPFVALAYAPFTLLSFKAAYVVHTCLMALCVLLAVRLLRPTLPPLGSYFAPLCAVCLTFYPLFRAVVGGQNSALSLLCAAGAIAALQQRRDFVAGLWIGAWFFKPQFAIPAALVACRSRSAVLGVCVGASICFLLSATIMGIGWPMVWLKAAAEFVALDRIVDAGNGISLVDVMWEWGLPSAGGSVAVVVAALVLALVFFRDGGPAARIGLASAAAPLVSPHALYYDGALALIALVAPAVGWRSRVLPWLAAIWVLGAAQWLRDWLFVPPVTIALIVALVAGARSQRPI
jgi:hypothetical protein